MKFAMEIEALLISKHIKYLIYLILSPITKLDLLIHFIKETETLKLLKTLRPLKSQFISNVEGMRKDFVTFSKILIL